MGNGTLMTPEYDQQRAAEISRGMAPPQQTEMPELTEKQRRSAKLKGVLYGLLGTLQGGPAGGILSGMEGAERERNKAQYQGYMDKRLEQGDMTTQQRDAMMARRYGGEKYGATSRPWWSSSQKPQIMEVPLPGGMIQNYEIGPDGQRTKSGAPYPMWNPDSYSSRGRQGAPTKNQQAQDQEIFDARRFVRSRSKAQIADDVKNIMSSDDPTSWIAKKYHLASQAATSEPHEQYREFMDEVWGTREPHEEAVADTGEEKKDGGYSWFDPRGWLGDDKPDSVESLEDAMKREQ